MSSAEEGYNFLPESLALFLRVLFSTKDSIVKIASIGQAVVQATRPRVLLTPLQLGLGVQLHHQFGSRFLIDMLHKLGFCCSYGEVSRYETNSAIAQGTNFEQIPEGGCVQYIADNVDHNICTIDGLNTFHIMSMMATVTPGASQTKVQMCT